MLIATKDIKGPNIIVEKGHILPKQWQNRTMANCLIDQFGICFLDIAEKDIYIDTDERKGITNETNNNKTALLGRGSYDRPVKSRR